MLGVFIAFDSTYTAGAAVLLGLAFYLIASGCSFFGLLTTRGARRLGNASYGIYLLQGLVLTLAFSIARARNIALGSAIGHWSMVLLCAVVLVGISAAAHIGIERTGIALGRRLVRALGARPRAPIQAAMPPRF
jgi:peptidoglycan/LPS O-acetylase OafA/YrhL